MADGRERRAATRRAATPFGCGPQAMPRVSSLPPPRRSVTAALAGYLLITTGADVVLLPEVSVATTVIVCCPLASDPVSHHCVDWQLAVPPHATWANCVPSP